MIKFLLLVNKQGQTRLARYFGDELRSQDERRALEAEAVRRCLARSDRQASFFEHRSHRIVYRRYASLFFLAGVDEDEVGRRFCHWGVLSPLPPMIRCLEPRPRFCSRVSLARAPIETPKHSHPPPTLPRTTKTHNSTQPKQKQNPQKTKPKNELAALELVHALVEALDRHFGQVCELDIMSEPDTVHYILDEMVLNGSILDTNRAAVLEQVALLEKLEQ